MLLDGFPPDLGGMSIGQLEGYVAGVLVCPETIPPSEWLTMVWGGDGAPEEYVTIYEADEISGDMLWGSWINCFERAVRLRADAWERIASDGEEEAAVALFMIDEMHAIDMGRSNLTEEAIDDLDRTASDLISAFVRTLRAWPASRRPDGGSAPGSNVVAFSVRNRTQDKSGS